MKSIAVLTSGGDAPGMNAAVRAVVRAAIYNKLRITGIHRGYQGLLDFEFEAMELSSVANIIQKGGTILKTARCKDFYKASGRKHAAENFKKAGFDGLIVIGGNGTFKAAHTLWVEHKIPIVAIPSTIDNDINGTDTTIGFDTAVQNAVEAIDKIRDTAASHDRLFIVEVMGRNSGHIALEVGLACGAESIFAPECKVSIQKVCQNIKRGAARGKKSSIIICAEGDTPGRAYEIAAKIKRHSGFEAKVCILGHIQRGGNPTARGRNLASRLGVESVKVLLEGRRDVMVAIKDNKIQVVQLSKNNKKKPINLSDLRLTQILSI
ncbi:MAG: 6-phosphofructokinase [Oligoflexia bacterium]|nr:6-phosphofructokinase [Oligoflexia bacterium]